MIHRSTSGCRRRTLCPQATAPPVVGHQLGHQLGHQSNNGTFCGCVFLTVVVDRVLPLDDITTTETFWSRNKETKVLHKGCPISCIVVAKPETTFFVFEGNSETVLDL